jgi:hypothetical protein
MTGKIIELFKKRNIDDAALFSIILFAGAWLFIGNFWSIVSTYRPVNISSGITILSAIIYLIVAIPVIIFFFIELFRLKSKIKWFIAAEVIVFFAFVIAPPRNADAMRVWLAKVYDVWMHGKKIIRPYWHYNTPDAFTLFHLPLINLWDGQVFQMSIWVALCAALILFIKIGRVYLTDKGIAIGLCLFVFNPLIILASTVVLSDIPMILAVAGLLYAMLLYEQGHFNKSLLLVVFFAAFGMNVRYNMLMFLPAALYWAFQKIREDGIYWKSSQWMLILIGLAVLPYCMNYFNIGNPFWPVFAEYFPSNNPYWDEVAIAGSSGAFGGERNLWSFIQSFYRLFLMPHHINPLAIFIIFFVFARHKHLDFIPALFVISYIFILWLIMPQYSVDEKERYVLYLLPIIIPFGISKIYGMESSCGEKIKKVFESSVVIAILIYSVFTFVYSKHVFSYIYTGDKEVWHKDTWYYTEYDWINKNITLNASENILVIVPVQQTYYLKKPYINADALSAVVPWRTMTNVNSIMSMIKKHNIRYIFVDEDYAKSDVYINRAFDVLIENKRIEKIRENKVRQCSSRIRDIYTEVQAVLYKVRVD